MSLLASLFYAFDFGLASSLSLCLATCLPAYLPILFGYGDDTRKGFLLAVGFAAGRFAGYFSLGVAAALLGALFSSFFQETFPKISALVIFVLGVVSVVYGVSIFFKANFLVDSKKCSPHLKRLDLSAHPLAAAGTLGFATTITPCVPVFTFLLLPFAMGMVWETALVTVAFGLGANVVFIFIAVAVAFGLKQASARFKNLKRWLEIASAVALVVLGVLYALWAVGPLAFGLEYNNYVFPNVNELLNLVKAMVFRK